MPQRIIGLLDMDYFYAQIEERDNPELKGKPVVIGMYSGRSADSGAVATCNYKARSIGIHSGQPLAFAKKAALKDPETVFLPVRIDYYRSVSEKIMAILQAQSGGIETVGLDEAYFDLSEKSHGSFEAAEKIAEKIKAAIRKEQHLSCSIGLAPNKLVAKIACDSKKPDGLTVILPSEVPVFLRPLKVKKLLGVGPKTEEKLKALQVETIGQLEKIPLHELVAVFGNAKGKSLFESAKGIDDSPIESDWQKLQLSRIKTLPKDSADEKEIRAFTDQLSEALFERVKKERARFKEVSFIAVSTHLENFTKNRTLPEEAFDVQTIQSSVHELIRSFFVSHPEKKLRRVGVRVGKLNRGAGNTKTASKNARLSDFA